RAACYSSPRNNRQNRVENRVTEVLGMRRPLWLLAAAPVLLGFTCVEKSAVNPKAIRHNTQGAELLARGALDEAETHFDLAIEYHPRFEKPHYNKGLIAFRRGDLEAALGHFLRAADMNPDYA